MRKCQGGYFVIVEKIKKQKGIANSKTWQKFLLIKWNMPLIMLKKSRYIKGKFRMKYIITK